MTATHPKAKRIGIYGGSFNPLHLGHLIIAQDAAELLGLTEVVFIPAAIPPHKQNTQQAAAEHRLNMLKLAIEEDDRFSVSDMEIRRGGLSFMADTVRDLTAESADTEWFLLIGSDNLAELHKWHRIKELLRMCTVATIWRPGSESPERLAENIRLPESDRQALMKNVITAHEVGISSSEIRSRIAAGMPVGYFVPPAVESYICEHGLYKE